MEENKILQIFNFEGSEVRTITDEQGEPWWVANDVCAILDIKDVKQAIDRLDEDERGRYITPTPGGPQEMLHVNESGLYSLIFTSRKPEAKAFKRWVTHEVLPAIRKTGSYVVSLAPVEEFEAQLDTFARGGAIDLQAVDARKLIVMIMYLQRLEELRELPGVQPKSIEDRMLVAFDMACDTQEERRWQTLTEENKEVLEALSQFDRPIRAKELAKQLGKPEEATAMSLTKLTLKGYAKSTKKGYIVK